MSFHASSSSALNCSTSLASTTLLGKEFQSSTTLAVGETELPQVQPAWLLHDFVSMATGFSWINCEEVTCFQIVKTRAETRGESFVFTCKGCTEVKVLVKEVEGLKQMVEEMMEKFTGLRLEDKGEETESRVTKSGANQESEEAAGNVRTELGDDHRSRGRRRDYRTEGRKEICAGTPLMATHAYTKNQERPVGKEIDLRQWDTLIFKGEHADNEHWRL